MKSLVTSTPDAPTAQACQMDVRVPKKCIYGHPWTHDVIRQHAVLEFQAPSRRELRIPCNIDCLPVSSQPLLAFYGLLEIQDAKSALPRGDME